MTADEIGRQLYKSVDAFLALGPEGKADAIKGAADEAIGDEEQAILKSIPGIPDSLVEAGSDTLLNIIHAAVLNKFLKQAQTAANNPAGQPPGM